MTRRTARTAPTPLFHTISVSPLTHQSLQRLLEPNQTMDDLICSLIEAYREAYCIPGPWEDS